MKKLLMPLVLMPLMVFANTEVVDGVRWYYTVSDGNAILGLERSSGRAISDATIGAITIPSTLGGCPVTRIGDYAFFGCFELTDVMIPECVTSIGGRAFLNCSSLTSVTIPESVKSIGSGAFYGCYGMTSVTIPSNVTKVEKETFRCCSGLTSVTIPSGVTSIGDYAFDGCTKLTSLTIPLSVTSIGSYAFRETKLEVVFVADKPQDCVKKCFGDDMWFQKIGQPINYEWKYSTKSSQVEITGVRPAVGDVTIPPIIKGSPVTSIGSGAFRGCSGLTSVAIPSSVTSIGKGAFESCIGLRSLVIPSNVMSVLGSTFSRCSGLETVTIPDGVTSIGDSAFEGCSGLKSVTVPSSVTSIGDSAFEGCSGLTSVMIPDGVVSIGYWAFKDCRGLTSVTIPSGVACIEYCAFLGCSGLTDVTISPSVTSIRDYAFYGCSGLTDVTIPPSVTSIGEFAFYDCSKLTSVTIPNGVKVVRNSAFSGCRAMTDVKMGEGITNIFANAFHGSSSLLDVKIPKRVVTIGSDAFNYCGATNVVIPASVRYIDDAAFAHMSHLKSVEMLGIPPSTRIRETTAAPYHDSGSESGKGSVSASAGTSGGMGLGSLCDMLVFYSCSSNAVGYYLPQYASEWESVLTPKGTWQGLTMKMKVIPVIITFDPNGGVCSMASKSYTGGSKLDSFPVPTRSGYAFDGWYTSASGGMKVFSSTVVTGDMTLYAHWIKDGGGSSGGEVGGGPGGGSGGGGTGSGGGSSGAGGGSSSGGDPAGGGSFSADGKTFVIRNEEDFYEYIVEASTSGKTFIIANDLLLTGEHVVMYSGGPVSTSYHYPVAFYGTLKGNGHTIRLDASCSWRAIFGEIYGATIENIVFALSPQAAVSEYGAERTTFSNVLISAGLMTGGNMTSCIFTHCEVNYAGDRDNSYGDNVYGCFGRDADNCQFNSCKGSGVFPRTPNDSIGGFVRKAVNTTFDGCRFEGTVESNYGAGGIAAEMKLCLVRNCEVKATVAGPLADGLPATGAAVGGVAGKLSSSTVTVCRVSGKVSQLRNSAENVGGIVGFAEEKSVVSSCYSTADVIGRENVGGVVGYLRHSDIENVECTGAIRGRWTVGGIVGQSVGSAYRFANISCSVASGSVSGLAADAAEECRYLGGCAGHVEWSKVSWCGAMGQVECRGPSLALGGFAGTINECTCIDTSYALGSVLGEKQVGGFVGGVYAPSEYGHASIKVRNCYARGAATETTTADSRGAAAFMADIGSAGDTVFVLNCYATGKVTVSAPEYNPLKFSANNGLAIHGGLSPIMAEVFGVTVGITGEAMSSYWDIQTTKQEQSGLRGAGKTTVEMGRQSTYAGWDFNTIWIMQNGYPVLRDCPDCQLPDPAVPLEDPQSDDPTVICNIKDEYRTKAGIGVVPVKVVNVKEAVKIAVKGLPSGVKFTAKDIADRKSKKVTVPANSIYGTPTKSGVYAATVTVTPTDKKSKMAPIVKTLMFVVRNAGEHIVRADCDAAQGTVKGMGVYAPGKKVTLKVTAAKGYVFSGWYDGDALISRLASYVLTMPDVDVNLMARFVTVVADKGSIALAVTAGETDIVQTKSITVKLGMPVEWPVAASALSATTVKVSGLPSGLKFTAKDVMKKGSKTEVEIPANTIYGTPKTASKTDKNGNVTPSKVKITVTTAGKQKQEYIINVIVRGIPAEGTFNGGSASGLVTLTVAKTGKISGKYLADGKTWTLSAAGFDTWDDNDRLTATLTAKSGKEVKTVKLTHEDGYLSSPIFEAWRNEWKDEPLKTLAAKLKGKKVQVGEVLLTVGSDGAVTAKGTFGSYSASCSTVLIPTESKGTYVVYLYFPPKAGKFDGFTDVVEIGLGND